MYEAAEVQVVEPDGTPYRAPRKRPLGAFKTCERLVPKGLPELIERS
jgi:hypothetical protein